MSAFCPESRPDADTCVVGHPCARFPCARFPIQPCDMCGHVSHDVDGCGVNISYDHINGDHLCDCPGSLEQQLAETKADALADVADWLDQAGANSERFGYSEEFRRGFDAAARWVRRFSDHPLKTS